MARCRQSAFALCPLSGSVATINADGQQHFPSPVPSWREVFSMAKRVLYKAASKLGFTTKGAAGAYPWVP
ncbi:hypothetical protein YW7DRAFT_05874 [Streptomyces sp. AmelKG-E11A]|nr:hypothetical protein YW7DRAFT_05874 [Streptomyces sp. AmelKG-E11A]